MAATFVAELDQMELACRLVEALLSRKRPEGATAAKAMGVLDQKSHDDFMRAAMAAIVYLKECVEAGSKVN